MRKTILFFLFLIFYVSNGYSSETILNYKYSKKNGKKTPIEFVKITKYSDDTYNVKYKIAINIINSKGILFFDRIDGNSNFHHKGYPLCYANSYAKDKNSNFYINDNKFYINDNYNCSTIGDTIFEFCFDNEENQFEDIKNLYARQNYTYQICQKSSRFGYYIEKDYYEIERKNGCDYDTRIEELSKNNKINIINPVRIKYKYNKQNNSFDVIQTVCYIDEIGELKTKDIDVTDTASDVIRLNKEIFSTDFYKNFKENEEKRIADEEKDKQQKRKKELLPLAEKIKNGQDISQYTEEDIKEAFELHFNAIIYDQYSSNIAISNIEKNKNIYYQPIKIFQIVPNKGILGEVVTNTFFIGGGAFVRTKPYFVYIEYKNTKDFIDDQLIEVYAKITGTFSYQNAFGGTMTVPKLKAYFVKKIKSYY